jgi:hypothetical protein
MATGSAGRTTPTEADIRAYVETHMADWTIWGHVVDDLKSESDPFEDFVDIEHITDADFDVWAVAHDAELEALVPAMSAALRPFLVDAHVRAAVGFFERFPNAPLAGARRRPPTGGSG